MKKIGTMSLFFLSAPGCEVTIFFQLDIIHKVITKHIYIYL